MYLNTKLIFLQMFITWLLTINVQLHIWNALHKLSHNTFDGILSMQSVFKAQTTEYQIHPFFVDSSSFI